MRLLAKRIKGSGNPLVSDAVEIRLDVMGKRQDVADVLRGVIYANTSYSAKSQVVQRPKVASEEVNAIEIGI